MGVTRVRFLLDLWRRSSLDIPHSPQILPKVRKDDPSTWILPDPGQSGGRVPPQTRPPE